jgi:hypothetical protein
MNERSRPREAEAATPQTTTTDADQSNRASSNHSLLRADSRCYVELFETDKAAVDGSGTGP